MALVLSVLKSGLERDWLVAPGGCHPDSALASGDRFAGAVVSWFSSAQAGAFPCSTAAARRSQLATMAAAAFQARAPQAAGLSLAQAVAAYIAGQVFGVGVASLPLAVSAAALQMGTVFSDTSLSNAERAQSIAGACALLSSSTLVIFPATPPLAVV